jgi:hypothetical protein
MLLENAVAVTSYNIRLSFLELEVPQQQQQGEKNGSVSCYKKMQKKRKRRPIKLCLNIASKSRVLVPRLEEPSNPTFT